MGWLKKKYSEKKEEYLAHRKYGEVERQKARTEYYKVSEEQRIRLARVKATQEALAKERSIKAKYGPKPPRKFNFNTAFGSKNNATRGKTSPNFSSMQPSGMMKPSYFAPAVKVVSKPKHKRRRSSSNKTKYIIRGGKAYQVY